MVDFCVGPQRHSIGFGKKKKPELQRCDVRLWIDLMETVGDNPEISGTGLLFVEDGYAEGGRKEGKRLKIFTYRPSWQYYTISLDSWSPGRVMVCVCLQVWVWRGND